MAASSSLTDHSTLAISIVTAAVVSYYLLRKTRDERLPPHCSSWIPYLGSAIAVGKGMDLFIRETAKKLKAPVFTATLMGDQCLMLAEPEDLSLVFKGKYQSYLDSYSLQKDFVSNVLGANAEELEGTFQDDVNKLANQQYHQYLFKGQELEQSMAKVQDYFRQWITTLPKDWHEVGLYDFIGNAIFKASTGPLLSSACPKDEHFDNFREFDKGAIPLFNKIPPMLLKKAIQGREALVNLVQSKEYWEGASPLMQKRKETLKMPNNAFDRANVGLLWATNGNSIPAVFWMFLRLLDDPAAWNACRDQVQEVVNKRTTKSNTFTLDELDELTYLESAFLESLRMYQSNTTARKVTEDFMLESSTGRKYLIPKDTKLIAFWKVMHMDEGIFENPHEFQFDRFVESKAYKYASGRTCPSPVIPFGGGSHLCPGRKFIGYEARLLAAMLMLNVEFSLNEDRKRPDIDLTQQGIGVSQPTFDPKVRVKAST